MTSADSRRGLVVAVVGPDGAGKSTLVANLLSTVPGRVRTAYVGSRPWSGAGARLPGRVLLPKLWSLTVARRRLRAQRRRDGVLLLDRLPADLVNVAAPGGTRRAAEQLLARAARALEPDALIVLDAPAEVMLARKGEHSLALLEERRRDYAHLAAQARRSAVLDATQPPDELSRAAADVIARWRRELRSS